MPKNRKDVTHMLRNQKGFTLMELMIVIVIIGVLAAIGIPAYTGYVERATKAACNANARSLETAAGLYVAEHGDIVEESAITILNEYVDTNGLSCPGKDAQHGEYKFNGNHVECTVHGRF